MIDSFQKILVIAAHPDDEVLGVGGTIPLLAQAGKTVDVLIFTDGSSTQYAGDDKILEHKFKEAELAMKTMGANLLPRMTFPDMRLDTVAHVDKNSALGEIIQKGQYDTVFVQDHTDVNRDHKEIYDSAVVACRPVPGQCVRYLLSYYVNSSTEWGNILGGQWFSPNVFVDISETLEIKLKAMEAYQTELRDHPHPRSLEGLRTAAAYFGNTVGYQYAEPFRLIFAR
ncbi:N-acetylglucosaminyl deacetylase, LmbE family [Robiginitalea myxolifaciens]|uniref:N-acetylglucosaminyl deacetylase, LmbE family n=1 Tax=Robiginitalea myxolifaciens TaxID=400055 RepID=A0A1I6H2D0_9FLAO|nr:PIG-L deacetylase family protein [Robiginitalea myxolifaciens]SFR48487.1 N-acetylglucosaminyl deacetylase, LmbE family [Robiginitalea myxolifaciens]